MDPTTISIVVTLFLVKFLTDVVKPWLDKLFGGTDAELHDFLMRAFVVVLGVAGNVIVYVVTSGHLNGSAILNVAATGVLGSAGAMGLHGATTKDGTPVSPVADTVLPQLEQQTATLDPITPDPLKSAEEAIRAA